MDTPIEFYLKEQRILEQSLEILKKKSMYVSISRFIIFFVASFLMYFHFAAFEFALTIAFFGIIFFGFFVVLQTNLTKEKTIVALKIKINTIEIKALKGDFFDLESGKEFVDPNHFYSNDIDLFGLGSFFQYTNRTVTINGKKELANILTGNKIKDVLDKQKAVIELSKKAKWRQHFSALGSLTVAKDSSDFIVKKLLHYIPVFPNYASFTSSFFSMMSLSLIGLTFFNSRFFFILLGWYFIGLILTGWFFKKIQQTYTETDALRDSFKQYYPLLYAIEKESFDAKNLKEKQALITLEKKNISSIFKDFFKILDAFDQRNNFLIAALGNGFFLWDIKNAHKVENWIVSYKNIVEKGFETVAYFDAQNSLANVVFNHPMFIFPKITSENTILKTSNLAHPLLNSNKRIGNDFIINDAQFFIITGANMAGKSTFLRAVSLSIVMANCGLPVCAEDFNYSPIKLITSMRTSDSLADNESYFYSELKRLKFIVDKIELEKYFIVLDEILKGTNSEDKAIGSKKFVERLHTSKSTGIIATHDVSLCVLENKFPEIKNYYFDAKVIDSELSFDYKFKSGICKNMNASFLLNKMKII